MQIAEGSFPELFCKLVVTMYSLDELSVMLHPHIHVANSFSSETLYHETTQLNYQGDSW